MIPHDWLIEAEQRISPHINTTPLTYDPDYDLYLKWENHQVTGSFKARGAFNKVLSLEKWEQEAGIIAASAGNHGQGVALASQLVGAPVKIFASENAPSVKIHAMQALGAEVILVQGGYGQAEQAAIKMALETKATWISPYNDGLIIAGQGTIGLELIRELERIQTPQLDHATWLIPTSGGGLLAGIGAAVRSAFPKSRIVGVQTDTSPFMHALFHQGTQDGVVELPTIADGLSGSVENGAITIPLVRQLIDDIILVTEEETAQAVSFAWYRYGERIEGSAAVGLGAILNRKIINRPIVAIISGGNIQDEIFDGIIKKFPL